MAGAAEGFPLMSPAGGPYSGAADQRNGGFPRPYSAQACIDDLKPEVFLKRNQFRLGREEGWRFRIGRQYACAGNYIWRIQQAQSRCALAALIEA